MPGRTLSAEMRLISDVRLINNFCAKSDYPSCANPSLSDIERRVGSPDRNFSGAPRRVARRDVSDSFKRVATRPDCASVLCTEFPGTDLGLPRDIVIFWSALPFGWAASPGYFQACAMLVTKLHCAYQPVLPMVGDILFSSHMFADDALIVEVDFHRGWNKPQTHGDIAATMYSETGPSVKSRHASMAHGWKKLFF